MHKSLFLLISFIVLLNSAGAQSPPNFSTADIYMGLEKLGGQYSVLYIAAHPDDENTRLLSYLSKEKNYRTAYLSVTRGDGGQNLIGDEQGIELGLIRTQELLAARRVDGAQQFFTRAYDFGYSKSPKEALEIWGHEKVLSDLVYIIRYFRPDIIITRFPETGEGGHGHHTASAILASEAFEAAGNPSKFAGQLQTVSVWQPKRLLWNTFNFGGQNLTAPGQFRVDVGRYNQLLGKSYGEIAATSRSNHKSQGFGAAAQRGRAYEFFRTIKGTPPVNDLMDGVEGKKPDPQFDALLKEAIDKYNFKDPTTILPVLQKMLPLAKDDNYKKQIGELILAASGIFLEFTTPQFINPIGDSVTINGTVVNRNNLNVKDISFTIGGRNLSLNNADSNRQVTMPLKINLPSGREVSQPYWLQNTMDKGSYNFDQQLLQDPDASKMTGQFQLTLNDIPLTIERSVMYKYTDPVKGEIYEPAQFSHPAYLNLYPPIVVFKKDQSSETKPLTITLQSNINTRDDQTLSLEKTLQDGKAVLGRGNVHKETIGPQQKSASWSKTIDLKGTDFPEGISFISPRLVNAKNESQFFTVRQFKYDHLPALFYHYQDKIKVLKIDLKTAGKKAGFIYGAGDKVPEALIQLGYEVITLRETDLTPEKIAGLDVIVSGVRAYNTEKWLSSKKDILSAYVKNGGVYFVQYNTNNNFDPLKSDVFPFEFSISRSRITDENSPVKITDISNPVINYPNKITAKDFEGWIQERSIYQADRFGKEFTDLLTMQDEGENETGGSLLVANHGKGRFVYSGLVFFRQLPAGVPGAYRLFANLIAKPR